MVRLFICLHVCFLLSSSLYFSSPPLYPLMFSHSTPLPPPHPTFSYRKMWVAGILAAMASITYPSISSLVSRNASSDQQGVAMGILTGMRGLCNGLGPALFGLLFWLFNVSFSEGEQADLFHPSFSAAHSINSLKKNTTVTAVHVSVFMNSDHQKKNIYSRENVTYTVVFLLLFFVLCL